MDIRTVVSTYNLWASGITPGVIGDGGYISLEVGWNLVAIPVRYGYWDSSIHSHIHDSTTVSKFKNYIYDQILDKYGTNKIGVANVYVGDNQFFWSYVPGITPDSSPHNFQLVYDDGSYNEIVGCWIKNIHTSDLVIQWGKV